MKPNKLSSLCLVLVICEMFLTGCGSNYIGKDKALEIALGDASLTQEDVRDVEVELDREVVGATAYEVSFENGFDDYEYVINAETGEIIKSKMD